MRCSIRPSSALCRTRRCCRSELTRSLDQSISYEDMLDRLRLFGQEHMFLIGVRILSGTVSAEQAGEALRGLPT